MRKDLFELLASENRGLVLWSHGNVYIGAGFARDFVRWIQQRSGVILRLEGLETDGRSIRPLLDYIADIPDPVGSVKQRSDASASLALRVLDEWDRTGGPAFIDFLLESDRETE